MIDLVTYCSDSGALAQEVGQKYPDRLAAHDDGSYDFNVTKVPTKRNGALTLCLVRCTDQASETMLRSLVSLEVLGPYDVVFSDTALDVKYKTVHPYDVPIEKTLEDGTVVTYLPEKKIGGFGVNHVNN